MSRKAIGTLVGAVFFLASVGLFLHPFIAEFSYEPHFVWASALCSILLAVILNRVIGGPPTPVSRWIQPGPVTMAGKGWGSVVAFLAMAGTLDFSFLLGMYALTGKGIDSQDFQALGYFQTFMVYATVLLLALFAVVMSHGAIKELLEYLRFGRTPLHLDRHPLSPGEQLTARLQIGKPAADLRSVLTTLVCIEVVYKSRANSGKHGSSDIDSDDVDIWSKESTVPIGADPRGCLAGITFEIPSNLPVTSVPENTLMIKTGREYHRWELRITADIPGVDLDRSYPILIQARVDPGTSAIAA